MGAPWQGQPPVQGKEWGQPQRGRCSRLSCSSLLLAAAQGRLCAPRGQGSPLRPAWGHCAQAKDG